MRGAGLRLNNDVRRQWRCAACGAERRVGAEVTTVRCQCAGRPAMKLLETMRRERPLKELSSPYLEFEFEPGELAPPRSREEESLPVDSFPGDAETSAAIEQEVNEGGLPMADDTRPTPSSRPPRREDRRNDRRDPPRNDRGPFPPRGRQDSSPQRRDSQPRPSQPPRPENREAEKRDPMESQPLNEVVDSRPAEGQGDGGAEGSRPSRRNRRPRRRGPRPEGGGSPQSNDSGGFGEGIPTGPGPAPQS